MNALRTETILTMREAAERGPLPVRARTVREWCSRGVRGVKLESLKYGHFRVTSVEALQRFAERLTAIGQEEEQPMDRTPTQRQRADQAAELELIRRGA